ncbi:MAG: leucine-rich repeat protein [Butyricicoccaceae bacterium]
MEDIVFGNWRVCEEIGRGGFGYVCRIEREDGFGGIQECALKVVHIAPEQPKEHALDDMLREVRSEVETMIRLKGTSNIVTYEDHALVPMERGGAVVACRLELRMELLDSLPTLMAQDIHGIMNEPTVLRIAIDLCQALILCHGQNILHRDIKPSNIFRNRFGNYKLGDFGIARLLDQSHSMTRVGTKLYAAPEVFHSGHYDQRADLYSLGIVMYALLNNGNLPLQNASQPNAHQATELRCAGRAFGPPAQASEGMAQVILKACAYDPEERYATAQEMFDALMELCVPETGSVVLYAGSTGLQMREMEAAEAVPEQFDLSEPLCAPARLMDSFGLGVRWSYETRYWMEQFNGEAEGASGEQTGTARAAEKETRQPSELTRAEADRLPPFRPKFAFLPFNHVNVPDGIGAIGSWAFHNRGDVTVVTLPKSVHAIGESAFAGCSALREVHLPDGLTHIGSSAFSDCQALRKIALPDSITTMGEGVFLKSRLTRITLPIGLQSLPERTFAGCTVLSKVEFTPSLRHIGNKAFMNTAIQELYLPNGILSIGTAAFRRCRSLRELHLPDELSYLGAQAFSECTGLTSVLIPQRVGSIPDSLFSGCSALKEVVLPEGLQSIGSQAFAGCEALNALYIPASVTAIASDAFGTGGRIKRWMSKLAIHCVPGSYAWDYCGSNHIKRIEAK